jgi:uncharacterized phage-associated protein
MIRINQVCDYIIVSLDEAGERLNLLKLHKLLYYVQAWYLAFYKKPLFDGKFQAWVHGPVNREIYDRFSGKKFLYSEVGTEDVLNNRESVPDNVIQHIDSVLGVYAGFTNSQLESMARNEEPWQKTREGLSPMQRSEKIIDEQLMKTYYAARLD